MDPIYLILKIKILYHIEFMPTIHSPTTQNEELSHAHGLRSHMVLTVSNRTPYM
jgi:hypothetical protein